MPTIQDQAIRMTREAVTGVFRTARHVPADKIDQWTPMGEARTVLDQLTEIALTPIFLKVIVEGGVPVFDEAATAARKKAEAAITTIDQAEAAATANLEAYYAAIAAVPDEDLDKDQPSPFSDTPVKKADVLFYAYWNTVYHIGQINYIQMMLGDREMH